MSRQELPNGPAAAAVLAAGIGSLVLGVVVTLAEANAKILQALNLYNPVGPLGGKSSVAIVAWLVAWAVLHAAWKERGVDFGKVATLTFVLVGLGLLGTFPLFFELF